jgi:hypothetical protein
MEDPFEKICLAFVVAFLGILGLMYLHGKYEELPYSESNVAKLEGCVKEAALKRVKDGAVLTRYAVNYDEKKCDEIESEAKEKASKEALKAKQLKILLSND